MKLRNLLVLGALLLAGSASAAIQERQKPALPEPIDPVIDNATSMYMYNVGAEKFFCGGNSWGTQTSIGDEGYRVYFEQYVVDAEAGWDGTTVIFRDSCLAKSGNIMQVFFDNVNGGCFVDRGSQANYYWKLEKNANNAYYRLSMAECNPDYAWQAVGAYWGWDSANGTVVSSFLFPSETVHVDWGFCTVAAYDAYKAVLAVYNTAQELKTQIDAAVALGIDVAAWEAVYNNVASTTEELEAAIAAAKEALAKAEELTVDPMNPVSKTSMITNPSYDANNNTGWSGTTPGFQSYDNAEHYNKTFDSWQLVTGLPNGLYKMTVQGFYRPSDASKIVNGAVFYAANGTDSLTVAVPDINSATALASKPNNMQSSGDAFHAGHYVAELYFVVVDNQARIGIALPALTGGTDWVIWDNWQLTYYGNKGEATYTGAVAGLVNANLANFDGREAEMTAGTIDAYKATLNALTASDLTGLNAAVVAIAEANASVQANIDGWVKYANLVEDGNSKAASTDFGPSAEMDALGQYCKRDARQILRAYALTTEELLAEIEKLSKMIDDAVRASLVVNSDVTDMFLVNARYDDNKSDGWSGSWTAVNYGCMEAYERDWDAYQVVKDAPQGVYEVSLQGFYRVKRGQEAYDLYMNGGQTCPGHVYVNSHLNEVKCVFSEPVKHIDGEYIYEAIGTGPESNPNAFIGEDGDSIFFPNDMKTAGEAFTAGMYVSSANGLVAQKGDELRIGVKGKKQTATWVIWDNFKMIYRGKQIAYTLPYLQEAVAAAEVTLTQAMDKDTKELLQAAKANAEAHLNSTDEEAVFDALVQIYAANDSVVASADLFVELNEAAQEIMNAIIQYEPIATEAALNAANGLLGDMMVGLEGGLTKEEVKALLAKKGSVIVDLIIGNWQDASDDNVMDFTALLASPSFEDINGNATAEGWTGANGALGSGGYEFYQKTFDLYQELKNIPNGTYRIEVSAYERIGSSVNDYTTYNAKKDTATTYLYAGSAGDTIETKVARLASGAFLSNDAMGIEGCTPVDTIFDETVADTLMQVANTMASAVTMFTDYGKYGNAYYVKVTDGTLRLGIKKEVQGSNDWVMMDNWKLYYHGTNSKGIEAVVGTGAAVVKREIFTLGGAQVGKLLQGVNIIRNTHADGTVTVKKVIK